MRIWMTGGSGSGKSAAAALFAESGYKIVDADKISRKIVLPEKAAYRGILEFFGETFLLQDGQLDRRKLGRAVFSDAKKLEKLNAITHKYIIEEMVRQCGKEKNVVMDAPLPNTFGVPCDKTLFVTAPTDIRIERIMARDGISRADAAARIGAQAGDEIYTKMADAVLINDGDMACLREKTQKYIKEWFTA